MVDPQTLIEQHLAGEINEADHAELVRWLAADEKNRQIFLTEVDFYRTVRGALIEEQRELAHKAEQSGADLFEPIQLEQPSDRLTRQQYAGALTYVLRHTLTPKRLAMLATAAALLLGVTLAVVLLGGPEQEEQVAQTPSQENNPSPNDPVQPAASNRVVATLTAEHDARWDRRPGQDLYAGHRFTLTQGFAEITTEEGAVVILEAPATVELLDHNNAIRLHHGKLVGICETETSKGFLVRTPHMDVTDLGTRFGVDASRFGQTSVHVFDGEVEAASLGSTPIRLTSGQAASASSQAASLAMVPCERSRFGGGTNAQVPDYVLAYWRFEEGTPGQDVPHTDAGRAYTQPAFLDHSGHGNALFAFVAHSAPRYAGQTPTRMVPQSGAINLGALDDSQIRHSDRRVRNIFTASQASKPSQPIEGVELTQWTIEASVMPDSLEGEQAYVARASGAHLVMNLGLKDGRFLVWLDDYSGEPRSVESQTLAQAGQWYHLAATCDGQTLVFYIRGENDSAYVKIGQTPVDRAMPPMNPAKPFNVQIGGYQGGMDAQALLDEIRFSSKALAPHEFLFSEPKP